MRKSLKRVVSVMSIILLGVNVSVYGFTDVTETAWYFKDVENLKNKGVVQGYAEGLFKPSGEVSVGEGLKMLMMGLGYTEEELGKDIKGHWAQKYAEKAKEDGLVDWVEEELTGVMTRGEVARILNKGLKIQESGVYIQRVIFEDTTDAGIEKLYRAGILQGEKHGESLYYHAEKGVTRAELSTIIVRVQKYVGGEKEETVESSMRLQEIVSKEEVTYKSQPVTLEELEKVLVNMASKGELSYTVEYESKGVGEIKNESYRETAAKAFSNVFTKYPELFCYTNKLTYKIEGTDKSCKVTYLLNNPNFTNAEVKEKREAFEKGAKEAVLKLLEGKELTEGMTEKERAKRVYTWVIENVEYDKIYAADSYTGYGAIVNKQAVCQGYTALYNYMCKLVGVEVKGISGYAGEEHMWTLANLEGKQVHIDTTWGDKKAGIDYGYFAAESSYMAKTHTW